MSSLEAHETQAVRGGYGARLWLLGAAAAVFAAALTVQSWGAALEPALGAGYGALLAVLGLGGVLTAWAGLRPRAPGLAAGRLARLAFVLGVAAWVAALAAFPAVREPLVAALLGLAAAALGVVVLGYERVPQAVRGRLRFLDPLLVGLALAPVFAEGVLEVLDRTVHPVLLADTSSTRAWIESARLRPGKLRFGRPVNSRGYCDGEPPAPGTQPLAVVVGDSFGVGTVPIPLHYTALAERELPGVEVYNMGIVGTDPRHYLEMLRDEALPLQPDVVVLGLFVGNDLVYEESPEQALGFWPALFDRQSRLIARFVSRSVRLWRERARAGAASGAVGRVQGEEVAEAVSDAQLLERFPWLGDPALEEPTFSRAGYLKIESERARAITAPDAEYPALELLLAMKALVGERPLLLFVIPDEFQVEDGVWDEIATPELERDRPQRVLRAFCAEHGITMVDPLPALRAVPPLEDGLRHLYMLQDTHWNARGNEVAGRELAAALRPFF